MLSIAARWQNKDKTACHQQDHRRHDMQQ
ncbi:hypothetical protein A2U01_0094933, partial [Trifolium medium]|nr:hypothetical protein [Trifolium medium]